MSKHPKACKENKNFHKETTRKQKQARAAFQSELRKLKELVLPSRGDHNCPHKDAGHNHRLNLPFCLVKNHVGYCGICGILCSYVYGCPRHHAEGATGENLFGEDSAVLREIVAENRRLGIFEPKRKIAARYEAGRIVEVVDLEGEEKDESEENRAETV